ncbi:MAG: DUF3365 domain-containing protein [Bacteroidales bacterium]|nr:DUF3365 domain-containing protein [Bacteroidales bacterium]
MKRYINSTYLIRYSFLLAALWTLLLGAITLWDINQNNEDTLENAYVSSTCGLNKDILYRRRAAMHGGIYVPVTEKTQPNPYLSDIPDRDITTLSGNQLTLINPAYMTRQVYEMETDVSEARSHLTSFKPIRPDNKPDAWEKKALESFENGMEEVIEADTIDGRAYYRLMKPLRTQPGCLKCHEKDSYKINDKRVGISVSYPIGNLNEISESHLNQQLLVLLLLWTIGICIIFFGYFRIKKSDRGRALAEIKMKKPVCREVFQGDITEHKRNAEKLQSQNDYNKYH